MSCVRKASRSVAPRSTAPDDGSSSARQHAQQRRLAGAVDADQRDSIARAEPPGDLAQHRRARRRTPTRPRRRAPSSPSRAAEKRSSSTRSRGSGSSAISAVGRLDAELRLGGARRRPTPQPGQLLAQHGLAALLAHRVHPRPLGPRQHVRGVAALVLLNAAVHHLPGGRAHRVQEPAVMGDHEHRAAPRGQMPRQPVDALDVEVVGRLVEQQQLRRVQQQPGERDAPALAAAQRRDRRVQPGRQPPQLHPAQQPGQHVAKRRVGAPFVVGPAAHELVAHGQLRRQLVALPEQRHADAAGAGDRARVRLLHPADQPQQRRLAVAVAPDDADAVAGGDAQRHGRQDRAAPVALGDGMEVDEIARRQVSRR